MDNLRSDSKMEWLRLYTEARNDAKLRSLSDAEFRVWFTLLCFAGEQEKRGTIPPMPERLLAAEVANGDRQLLQQTLIALEELRIIHVVDGALSFLAWEKRQRSRPSASREAVAARVRKHRANRQNADVTRCNADVTPPELELEREILTPLPPSCEPNPTPTTEPAVVVGEELRRAPSPRRTSHAPPPRIDSSGPPGSNRPESRRDREGFIAATLAEADRDPTRRHWRAAIAIALSSAEPREPDRYQARILRTWLEGESLPDPPPPPPRIVTARDFERLYGLAPGERLAPGPWPSVVAAEKEAARKALAEQVLIPAGQRGST